MLRQRDLPCLSRGWGSGWLLPAAFHCWDFLCSGRSAGTDPFVAAEPLMDSRLYAFTQSTVYLGSSAKGGFSPWKKPNSFYSVPCIDLVFFLLG